MAKRSRKTTHRSYKKSDDRLLMLLAGVAAILVGFFAIFSYKNQSVAFIPTPIPNSTVTVNLQAQNKSGENGTAILREVSGKVVVTLTLSGFPQGISQPAHIHLGSCPNPGIVEYPLTSVLNGMSETTLNVTLSQLKAMGKLVVNVHKSAAQSGIYYSCGNLNL